MKWEESQSFTQWFYGSSMSKFEDIVVPSVFKILQLPQIAMQRCLKMMEPIELIDFSWCSKRTKEWVKSIKLNPSTFTVNFFGPSSEISLSFEEYQGIEWRFSFNTNIRIEESDIIETRKLDELEFYSMRRTKITGPKTVIELHSKVSSDKVKILRLMLGYMSEDGLKTVLDKLKTTETLSIDIAVVDSFRHRNDTMFNVDLVSVDKANWITIDNILDMKNCQTIEITDLAYTEETLNLFILKWINGHFPHLEYSRFETKDQSAADFNVENALKGIEYEFDKEVFRSFKFFKQNVAVEFYAEGGFDIRDKHGKKATCLPITDGDTYYFILFVWTEGMFVQIEDLEQFEENGIV
uniref:F-box domain-containing protein n=2 Tax=Caenorhabditis tropicalis TaxID=1561998 RepID=A0A1I7TMJ3_9PELO